MSGTHTPEPDAWFVPLEGGRIVARGGRVVAHMDEAPCDRSRAEERLIAAAPDMLAALHLALRNEEARLYMLPLAADAVDRASLEAEAAIYRAAYAKARGRAHDEP